MTERNGANTPPTQEAKEPVKPFEIGVYDELDPLKSVVIWGAPGPETALAKLLPDDISLFYDDFDVNEARSEMQGYHTLLEDQGVEVFSARDFIAYSLIPKPATVEETIDALVQRGDELIEEYGGHDVSENGFRDDIEKLFRKDVEKYGETGAIALAQTLSLNGQLPLGNMIYARDQMNVLLSTMVVSSMKKPIRKGEVLYYKTLYDALGVERTVQLSEAESNTFEGGDAYVVDGTVYVGVGSRTSSIAANEIFEGLYPDLNESSFSFVKVADPNAEQRPENEQMGFMHIDTWSFFFGDKQVLLLPDEAKRRRAIKLTKDSSGQTIEQDLGDYYSYLEELGYTIHAISPEEQQEFGCNNIALDRNRVIVPLKTNTRTIELLETAGQEIIKAPLYNITRGYGAAHCITGTLLRSK